jgi:hypothetical protein
MEARQTVSKSRGRLAGACTVLGVVLLTLGLVLGYASHVLFNSEAFSDRVAASLESPGVAALVAERVTGAVITNKRDLTAYRPLLEGAMRALIASEPFRGIVRRAARAGHESLMSGSAQRMILNLRDIGVILRSALATQKELADKIPPEITAFVGDSGEAPGGVVAFDLLRLAQRAKLSSLGLLFAGSALCVLAFALSPSRRSSLLRLGVSLTIIALVLRLSVRFGGEVIAQVSTDHAVGLAAAGLWGAFLDGFMSWALVLGAIGVILTAAASSLIQKVQWTELGRAAWQWLSNPSPVAAAGIWRGVALILVGLLASLAPGAALTILAFLAGVVLFFAGLQELFHLLLGALPHQELQTPAGATGSGGRSMRGIRVFTLGTVAVALICACVYFLVRDAATATAPQTIGSCNGAPELCGRPLNEVVFPATHNSMSAGDIPNWLFPNQEMGIPAQLNDGIRGFLFDVHYGVPVGDKIKTKIEDEVNARRTYEAALGKEGVEAAMRIRDRLVGSEEGEPGVYLCHGFCELGASAFVPMLGEIRNYLVLNPTEVLIVVIQDEGVTPADVEKSFQESGLIDFVYRGPAGPAWPTLGEMIAADERVVVFAENDAGAVPWYHLAYESMQETPYSFHAPGEFSCKPNRGGTGKSLFLVNHWIETSPAPLPSNAEIVNAYDFLLARAKRCRKERGQLPNLIAVDFYRTGDVVGVAKTLNGLKAAPSDTGKATP